MPQIEQISEIFASQLFWLLITFGLIYLIVGRGMLPKIESTVDARDRRISEDLAEAERARAEADAADESHRKRIDETRAEAMKLTAAAKQEAAGDTERRIGAADAGLAEKIGAAEARLRAATETALAEIEDVAAEAAQEMVVRLSGASVSRDEAAEAVKAALAHD